MPSRLFWKFFLAFWLATACSFLIGVGLLRARQSDPRFALANSETVRMVGGLLESDGLQAIKPILDQERRINGAMALYDAEGHYLAGNREIHLDRSTDRLVAPDGQVFNLATIEPPGIGVAPLLIGTVVSIFFSAGLAWYLTLPLAHLSRGFRAVSTGQLGTRVAPEIGTRRDEIADLAREFDGMAAQLEQLWQAQQRLLHNVSHELRSPLARLQVAIGLLRQSSDDRPTMIDRVEREADRLEGLLGEVLTLARLRAGQSAATAEKLDLMDLVTAIVEDANFEAQAKGCRVRLEGAAPFVTVAEGEVLYRAFENVIRNAVKYSPRGGEVIVHTHAEGDRLVVEVIDEGPGVPEAARTEIFDVFRRLEADEGTNEGFGLGLAIAREALERHAGSVRAEGGPSGLGLRMVIKVPRRVGAQSS